MISLNMAIGNVDLTQEENKTLAMIKEEAAVGSHGINKDK
jgi:hypothetical protein